MKTIDTKSLLLGVLATSLFVALTSSKSIENNNLEIVAVPDGIGVFNKTTNTIYQYKSTISAGIQKKPNNIYKVNQEGSGLEKMD